MILNVLDRKITIYFQTSFLYMYTSYYSNNKCINGELKNYCGSRIEIFQTMVMILKYSIGLLI